MTAGAGSGSTTINIEKVTTEEDTYTFDLETQISAKIGIGGAKVGVSAGFNYGYETTISVSEGTYIEETVPAMRRGVTTPSGTSTGGLWRIQRKTATRTTSSLPTGQDLTIRRGIRLYTPQI
jgi:hypothetical protein